MNLSATLARRTNSELLVTPWLEDYLCKNPNLVFQRWVAMWIADELSKQSRDRSNTFSASDSGGCQRYRVLRFSPLEAIPRFDADTTAILHDGTFRHLRWQAVLLDAGILDAIEVSLRLDEYALTGTMDGVGTDRAGKFGFELKGANQFTYRKVCDEGPKQGHLEQVHAYMLGSGLERFSLVYECKDSNEYKEFVVDYDESIAAEVRDELSGLNRMAAQHLLPEIKEECLARKGAFRSCPYAHACLDLTTWPETSRPGSE